MENKNNGREIKEFVTIYNINGNDEVYYMKNDKIDKIFSSLNIGRICFRWLVGA